MTNIFVANLDFGITSEDLQTTFSQFGKVSYAHVVYDKQTKKSKGYGYVEMDNLNEAIAAIEALNGVEIGGRALDIKIATPKENRVKKENKQKFKSSNKKFDKKFTPVRNAPSTGERKLRPRRRSSDS